MLPATISPILLLAIFQSPAAMAPSNSPSSSSMERKLGHPDYKPQDLQGWTVHVHQDLLENKAEKTENALKLLGSQLATIRKVVPQTAVEKLQRVPLWISPKYPNSRPGAEYHPNGGWLKRNNRIPELAKCVEFSNVDIFERECIRMPMLALHELAHAYHDQVIGFDNKEVIAVYESAKAAGSYEKVERWFGPHRKNSIEKAYAISNHKEYFAETSEALFGRNDFFPFNRRELQRHDPEMAKLLSQLWGEQQTSPPSQ